jgi:type IV pilus assembly protein PilX
MKTSSSPTRLSTRRLPAGQRGAVLVVSLLLLLVMTLLGLGASQSTRLQERMAGNQRDQELALQAAEASLRAGEALLAPTRPFVLTCGTSGSTCEAYEMGTLVDANNVALDLANQADTFWTTWSRTYQNASSLDNVVGQPQFVIEQYADVPDTLGVGDSSLDVVRKFYRATARSAGMTASSQVVVQSTYARITFD